MCLPLSPEHLLLDSLSAKQVFSRMKLCTTVAVYMCWHAILVEENVVLSVSVGNMRELYISSTSPSSSPPSTLPQPSGFTVEVTNNQWKTSVFAGVRVLLGNKPPDRCPSYIEVFGRRLPCNMAGNTPRWQDIPFTKEESLQADKTLKIKCKSPLFGKSPTL